MEPTWTAEGQDGDVVPRVPCVLFADRQATTGTAAAAVPIGKQRRSVGMTDVARASAGMNQLVEADDRQGGQTSLVTAALEGRTEVLELQQRNASERVRLALYALAAEYATIAAYSCIDQREPFSSQSARLTDWYVARSRAMFFSVVVISHASRGIVPRAR
ncbi:hypothetical protein [Streptomyces sp. NRRL S-1824]|uniref:hypothetical protein n=1 Tax=Streptomyces sp. NRRL S-1824 TaxID=1463889 RepID=UPI0004C4CDC4|nr:hypothetical protein [Streptomyces sp. NRRL S-1824]